MSEKIKHVGVVDAIEGCSVKVRILQASACSACKVSGHCNAAESKEKIVDVKKADTSNLSIGDEVMVSTSASAARRALLVGFGLPFVVMIVSLLVSLMLGSGEMVACLVAVAVLAPYYLGVYAFRERIGGSVAFELEINSDKKIN